MILCLDSLSGNWEVFMWHILESNLLSGAGASGGLALAVLGERLLSKTRVRAREAASGLAVVGPVNDGRPFPSGLVLS